MPELRFVSLVADPGGVNPRLQLATASGRIREVPLDRHALASLLRSSSAVAATQLLSTAALSGTE